MTDLTTKTAQSLHDKWCEQMREKGWHWKDSPCRYCPDANPYGTNTIPNPCACSFYSPDLIPWPDLPESRRQEYLATAKAVLPEIVGEVFDEVILASCEWCAAGEVPQWRSFPKIVEKPTLLIHRHKGQSDSYDLCDAEPVVSLRDRRLEELE